MSLRRSINDLLFLRINAKFLECIETLHRLNAGVVGDGNIRLHIFKVTMARPLHDDGNRNAERYGRHNKRVSGRVRGDKFILRSHLIMSLRPYVVYMMRRRINARHPHHHMQMLVGCF